MLKHNANERIKIDGILNHNWTNNMKITDEFEKQRFQNRRLFIVNEKETHRRAKSKSNVSVYDKYFAEKKKSDKLPLIKTKNNEIKDTEIYEMHMKLSKKYNGKVPTYLQPIGNSKAQKNQIIKIKNMVKATDYNTISYTDPNEYGTAVSQKRSTLISKTIVERTPSKFKNSHLSGSSIAELKPIKVVKKFNLII
jgi:hypothetical protein